MQSLPNEFSLIMTNLPSGYHREMQLTKEILFPAFQELYACIDMTYLMLSNIKIKEGILDDDKYELLYTVDSVNILVSEGMTFRDAYKQVGNDVNNGSYNRPEQSKNTTTHEGSIDRLCNNEIVKEMEKIMLKIIS
jgi:argininosuccinate lyase